MNEELDLWEYQGERFPNKYALVKKFNLSTAKFKSKIKDKEIIKLTQQAKANENNRKNI